jgi:hypothetical protein
MIELNELQSEQVCGGRGRFNRFGPNGRSHESSLTSSPTAKNSFTSSLSNMLISNFQINITFNMTMVRSSIFASQGNGSALVVA